MDNNNNNNNNLSRGSSSGSLGSSGSGLHSNHGSSNNLRKNESEVDLFAITSNLNTHSSVTQLLAARKPNKTYLSEKTPEELSKESRIIESIDKEYFTDDFNVGSLLDSIGADGGIDMIDQLSVKIYGYHEAVDSRFNNLIMKSYNGFVEGMSQVYEIEQDLTHSAVMCKSGKTYLDEVQKSLTAFGFILLQKHRKKQIYQYILRELERIRDINEAGRKIDRLLNQHDFPNAIQLASNISNMIISSTHYECISNITAGFESSTQLILDKIDSSFTEICHMFNEDTFESVIHGYIHLKQKQRLKDKIFQNFITNIDDHTKRILKTHLYNTTANPEEFKTMMFADMCRCVKEDQYVNVLLGILEHLSDLMSSHYQMRMWILDTLHKNPDSPDKDFYIDIHKLLFNFKKNMWNTIQKQVKLLLGSCSPSFKIEEFLKVLESTNQFIEVGHEFLNSTEDSNLLKTTIKEQSFAYFEHFHKQRIEDLRIMLENEMWHKVPLPNDFTVMNIAEFGSVINSMKALIGDTATADGSSGKQAAATTPLISPFLIMNAENTINLDPEVHRSAYFERYKVDGNPFHVTEGRKTLSEAAGDNLKNSSRNGSAADQNGDLSNTNSPLLSSTTINVIRLIGKYLQMMKILKQLSYPIFTAISQLLEYYVYTVFTFFGECTNSDVFDNAEISNVSPILKKTMQRLKAKFVGVPTTNTSSLLSTTHLFQSKLTSSPISLRVSSDNSKSPPTLALQKESNNDDAISIQWVLPKVSELVDLTNPKTLYGLEYRVIGLESMMFLVDAIMQASPLVMNLIPEEKKQSISIFYSDTVSVVSALRNVCYKNIASQILNFDQLNVSISSMRWELKDAPPDPSPYWIANTKGYEFALGQYDYVLDGFTDRCVFKDQKVNTMVVKEKSTNNNNNNNNEYEDNDSDTSEPTDYTGFQLIPDHDDAASEVDDDNNDDQHYETAARSREEEIRRQIELNNQFLNEEFTDFTSHSNDFHDTNQFGNDDGGFSDLKVNTNNLLFSDVDYFPSNKDDPFSTTDNNNNNNNNNSNNNKVEDNNKDKPIEYCERNEKGHLVLSKDKLIPPDHADVIRECMKNIKIDYRPMWSHLVPEEKWITNLKDKTSK
ncbi:hypothetical protein PPL_01719 [Heterostelium album PN500]|uniref:Uncharacterized protein n=1 Tax=Heterostelium pallidum (strain ATCC 26659 / Pp 5 / PN500) TaxID=670386 RepID=D3B0A3_HETP5|nr:hypothetical protein PPL_01719 [Heterostelium album PN500]EFA84727.1 hypothetical protein PPL_01719 [Heterostelium album PN500]|eukprot:XP_020436839.1 hypothetical protein PPL_01719 [Heterostelium album PN500]